MLSHRFAREGIEPTTSQVSRWARTVSLPFHGSRIFAIVQEHPNRVSFGRLSREDQRPNTSSHGQFHGDQWIMAIQAVSSRPLQLCSTDTDANNCCLIMFGVLLVLLCPSILFEVPLISAAPTPMPKDLRSLFLSWKI